MRNEIETKRNQQKQNEINEMKTKPTKSKWNQQKQNEIENGRKNNKGLKEIKPRLLPTHVCLSSGFDHHWTRILCIYSAGVCPFHLVASFKFGNHKSNIKSVERRGIKITEVQ